MRINVLFPCLKSFLLSLVTSHSMGAGRSTLPPSATCEPGKREARNARTTRSEARNAPRALARWGGRCPPPPPPFFSPSARSSSSAPIRLPSYAAIDSQCRIVNGVARSRARISLLSSSARLGAVVSPSPLLMRSTCALARSVSPSTTRPCCRLAPPDSVLSETLCFR